MTDTQPTMPQPGEPPRRLTRSTTDRLIGGVAGGIGRHLGVDPLAIRITFVILSFAGGLGLIAYLLCLAFVPTDDPDAPPLKWGLARTVGAGLLAVAALAILVPDWFWGPQVPLLLVAGAVVYLLVRMLRDDGASHAGRMAARIAIGIVLVAIAVGGFVAAAAGSALGGGIVVAGLVIACGVGLVGGAFRGGARWLIAPGARARAPARRRRGDRPRRARHLGRPHVSPGERRRARRRIRDGRRLDERSTCATSSCRPAGPTCGSRSAWARSRCSCPRTCASPRTPRSAPAWSTRATASRAASTST